MTIDPGTTAAAPAPSTVGTGPDRTGLERMKTVELAHEFEASMLLQMLRQMRQSIKDDSEDTKEPGLSSDAMMDTVDTELARQLSRSGGLGLADMMAKAISRQTSQGSTAEDAAGAAPALPAAAAGGWTADPLTGGVRFRGGVDLGAAYGHAAPGAGTSFNESGLAGLKLTDRDADSPIGGRLPTPVQ